MLYLGNAIDGASRVATRGSDLSAES